MRREPFTILIDGACPLCRTEAGLLSRLDGSSGRLIIEDIAAPGFDSSRFGVSFEALMGTIHGVCADGRLVTGMEVFRRAYAAVGWGWLLAPTAWPILRPMFDLLYKFFAKNRLRLTGRRDGCAEGRCRIDVQPAAANARR